MTTNFDAIKALVNMPEVGKDVKAFLDQLSTLSGEEYSSLDDVLKELKARKLAELMAPAAKASSTSRVGKYETDEERRLARNEASRKCKAKAAAELKALKEAAKA